VFAPFYTSENQNSHHAQNNTLDFSFKSVILYNVFYWETIVRYSLCSILLVCLLVFPALSDTLIEDFQVNSNFPGHPPQKSPYAVANWETETIYLTWLSQHDGEHWDVGFNRFNYDLEPLGDATYLNIRTDNADCKQPKLVLSDNGFGAAWIEVDTPNRLRFRSFDASGIPLCNPVNIIDNGLNLTRDSLNIAALNDGYLLVWYDERDSSKIWAQKFDFDGSLNGDNFPIRPDSTGSLLGVEAQNHPDGRVLVSWVVDGMYSRARWLDADGEFMGEVFEMVEGYNTPSVVVSFVRFNTLGESILYQYWGSVELLYYIDEAGFQVGDSTVAGSWWFNAQSGYRNYKPDVLYSEDSIVVSTFKRYYWYDEYHQPYIQDYFNHITAFPPELSIIPSGVANYSQLCPLNNDQFLYSFSTEYVGFRKYEYSTLDSSLIPSWIFEGEVATSQSGSDVFVDSTGSFRVIYVNECELGNQIYTRYFDADGNPVTDDTVASVNDMSYPVQTDYGQLETFGDDTLLIYYGANTNIYVSKYIGQSRTDEVTIIPTGHPLKSGYPYIDVNASREGLVSWLFETFNWEGGGYWDWLYYQGFDSNFDPLFDNVLIQNAPAGYFDDIFRVALKDDGHFLIAWIRYVSDYIYYSAGINYNEFTSSGIPVGHATDPPTLEKSPNGYQIVWRDYPNIMHQAFDSDGNMVGAPTIISDSTAIVAGVPDLAISETGNFAVSWQDARFDEGDIFCRQFNPDGSVYGYEYRVNSDPVGPLQKEPAVAFGPNDQLYFTWTDFRNEGNNGDIYCKVIEWEDAIGVEPEKEVVPLTFALHPPYPNPFNPTTTISYELPSASAVSLVVYDIEGCAVVKLVEGEQTAGKHQVTFNGNGCASGIYFVRMKAMEYSAIQKIALLK